MHASAIGGRDRACPARFGRAVVYIPQQEVFPLQPGFEVDATLLDGTTLSGALRFVASRADTETRSFRAEARIENPNDLRISGASATLEIFLPRQRARRLSPSQLVLEDTGELAVVVVNDRQRIEYLSVTLLSFGPAGVWVRGGADAFSGTCGINP